MDKYTRSFMFAALVWPLVAGAEAVAKDDVPFAGSTLLAVSDGAMLASGYIDGILGDRKPDLVTVLTVNADGAFKKADVEVSNSVATWPNILDLTPDGHYAIVTEPFAQPAREATEFSAIERGKTITVLDISNPDHPTVVETVDAGDAPAAVNVHPGGEIVAVTLPFSGQVALYPFKEGHLGEPTLFGLQIEGLSSSFLPEFKWHPSGEFAAVTLGGADKVAFYRYKNGELTLWGAPVRTAPLPGKGEWTPDGEYFIVTTITATGDMAQVGYGQNSSLFAVFDFDADDKPNSPPRRGNDRKTVYESEGIQHARIAHVPNGMGYVENFAMSPDGRWLVGANMAASWLPEDHPGRTTFSELTLFELGPETGVPEPRGTTRLDGVILPQGVVFDRTGDHVAVTSFQHDDRDGGSISFWKLDKSEATLTAVGETIEMPRGVHYLKRVD